MSPRRRSVYVEHCLPGSPRERVEHALRTGWALEVADGLDADWSLLRSTRVRVPVVQAWRLHEVGPLAESEEERARARDHILHALERGADLGAEVCVCVCGFGPSRAADPLGRCFEFFRGLVPRAEELGLRLAIEPLPASRAAQMRPEEIDALLVRLARPDVFGTVVDTGHLLEDGRDPARFLRDWPHRVDVLQLKERASRAPDDRTPLAEWLAAARDHDPWVSVEHREVLDLAEVRRVQARVEAAL